MIVGGPVNSAGLWSGRLANFVKLKGKFVLILRVAQEIVGAVLCGVVRIISCYSIREVHEY